jgi:class 3 adenylate cyclase/DNA-binding transcriptional MerR regulator
MDKNSNNDQITSKEIILKTGISRATLNNYIKMGILPKPVVKKGGPGLKGIKQIGFFPKDSIDRVQQVKRLKRDGMTMTDIVLYLTSDTSHEEAEKKETEKEQERTEQDRHAMPYLPTMEDIASKFTDIPKETEIPRKISSGQGRRTKAFEPDSRRRQEDSELTLSIGELRTPAYLINHNFEIEWINREAEDLIFNKPISSLIDIESRNLFRLFFSWEFHVHLRNWEEVIASHMAIVKNKIDKKNIANLYNGISAKEISFLEKIYDVEASQSDDPVHSSPVGFITQEGKRQSYQIYTMSFREGVFCVYIPTDHANQELMQILSNRGRVIGELLNQRMPSLISLCVLVADIQDSVRICGELLPEEYFELVNQLWKTVGGTFEKYNGIYGKHAGDGMLYYFLKRPGTSYIMDAIECALEMREKVREFSCNWKLRKNWLNDIYLNTAINEGQEFFGAIHSSSNVEFTALGDSINYTGRLSDFARYGSIWTTKNVISKLTQEERDIIRFGVHRRQAPDHEVFLENSFSRIIDLMEESGRTYSQFMDIATLPITEIVERVY